MFLFVILGRENIGDLSAFRTSFCGQVVCNPSFCERQMTRSHGNRLVVNSLVATSPFMWSISFHLSLLIIVVCIYLKSLLCSFCELFYRQILVC